VELHLSLRADSGTVAAERLRRAHEELRNALGADVFSTDGRAMEEVVGALLRDRGLTIAAAESCTGGLLMSRVTDVAGSSDYVAGGVVVYSNELKTSLAGVPAALIQAHGAVSEPVAAALADGNSRAHRREHRARYYGYRRAGRRHAGQTGRHRGHRVQQRGFWIQGAHVLAHRRPCPGEVSGNAGGAGHGPTRADVSARPFAASLSL
jgi:hypothetical protein